MANILTSREELSKRVDPFGARPCQCEMVTIHTTDGETLGEDLAECVPCGWRMTLSELYKDVKPPTLSRDGDPAN